MFRNAVSYCERRMYTDEMQAMKHVGQPTLLTIDPDEMVDDIATLTFFMNLSVVASIPYRRRRFDDRVRLWIQPPSHTIDGVNYSACGDHFSTYKLTFKIKYEKLFRQKWNFYANIRLPIKMNYKIFFVSR